MKLFLLPLHEALALPSGDNNSIGLHRSARRNGVMESWSYERMAFLKHEIQGFHINAILQYSNTPIPVWIFL
jgi:hypothetical protein